MNSRKTYYQLIPENVYNKLQTISELIRPTIKGYSEDYLNEVISIVACHIRKDEDYTPLKITYVKKLVPQGDKYLSGLIDLGIIERSGIASEKKHICYKYSFSLAYQNRYLSFPLDNIKLINRIETAQESFRKETAKSIRNHSEQVKYLKKLTIDGNFTELLESAYSEGTNQYNFILGAATRIINEDIYFSIDKTSGRFHSNVTNLAKGLRPYLRVNGEPLVNIDVKNSQPYLSTIILTNPGKVSWMTENSAFALLLQSLKVSLNEDVKNYINLVVSGQLYEFLMNEFAREGLKLTRDETKIQMLRILFARNRMPKEGINRQCRQVFKKAFPTVYRKFNKVRGRERGDKFHNFKRFAILLQRIESYLMLDVILKRIYRELPGTVAITIHDSVMTGVLTNNVEAVRKIMVEEMTKIVGFRPQIQIEENKRVLRRIEREEECINQYGATNSVTLN